MIELIKLDPTIKLDIKYATADNFVGQVVYPAARAFLQPVAAHAVASVHAQLSQRGRGLVIFDGYRPWSITKLFWEVVTEAERKFVADPATGSKHNRGCAVDLSMFDLATGCELSMPSGFDEFNEKASPDFQGGTAQQRSARDELRSLMEAAGFLVNPKEWWHFDHVDWEQYPILDLSFDDLDATAGRAT